MKCEWCGKPNLSPSTKLRRARKADGRCYDCNEKLTGDDTAYTRCFTCRKAAAQSQWDSRH